MYSLGLNFKNRRIFCMSSRMFYKNTCIHRRRSLMKNTIKPTSVRFDETTSKAMEFLKETNKGKFGAPTTAQILAYAIQLAVYEEVKEKNLEITEEIKALITNEDLKSKLVMKKVEKPLSDNPFTNYLSQEPIVIENDDLLQNGTIIEEIGIPINLNEELFKNEVPIEVKEEQPQKTLFEQITELAELQSIQK